MPLPGRPSLREGPRAWILTSSLWSVGWKSNTGVMGCGRYDQGPLGTISWAPCTIQDFLSSGLDTGRWKLQSLPSGSFQFMEKGNTPRKPLYTDRRQCEIQYQGESNELGREPVRQAPWGS